MSVNPSIEFFSFRSEVSCASLFWSGAQGGAGLCHQTQEGWEDEGAQGTGLQHLFIYFQRIKAHGYSIEGYANWNLKKMHW